MALQPPVPTPPYRTLAEAQQALYDLVGLVDGLLPVAVSDLRDRGHSLPEGADEVGALLGGDATLRRQFARSLVERLADEDGLAFYPIPEAADYLATDETGGGYSALPTEHDRQPLDHREYAARWNAATEPERQAEFDRIQNNARAAVACFAENHAGRLEHLAARLADGADIKRDARPADVAPPVDLHAIKIALDGVNATLKEGGINVEVLLAETDAGFAGFVYRHPAKRVQDRPQA